MALEVGAAGALRPGRRRRRGRSGVAAGSRSRSSSLVIGVVVVVVIVVVASLLLPMAAHGLVVGTTPTIGATGGRPLGSRRSARGRPQPQDLPASSSSSSSSRVAPGSVSGSVSTRGGSSRRVRNSLHAVGSSSSSQSSVAASAAPPSETAQQHQQEGFVRWRRREQQAKASSRPNSNASSTSSSSSSSPSESDCWCLQTAVMTYERIQGAGGGANKTCPTARVDLHPVVHVGEPGYYDDLNEELAAHKHQYDVVVYELLVDDVLLRPASTYEHNEDRDVGGGVDNRQLRVLAEPVGASESDRNLARSYGLVCQADHVRYTSPRFVHGDWTRQELVQHLQRQRRQQDKLTSENPDGTLSRIQWPAVASPLASLLSSLRRQQLYQEEDPRETENATPLWQQANRWSATHEAATALWVGPPILQSQTSSGKTRSSSNNNSGSFRRLVQTRAIRWFLRPLLWLTVPSPEIPILLLDWSALDANGNDRTDDNEFSSTATAAGSSSFPSPVSRAVLASLAAGQWDAARKLAFGQVLLVSSSTAAASTAASSAQPASSPDDQDWMQLRNQRAMEVLESIITQQRSAADPAAPSPASIAILYGCLHCPDLHARLVRTGFTPVQKTWRTAWSVPVPAFTGTRLLDSTVLQLLALLVFYLGVGGLDWIATVGDVTHAAAGLVRDVTAPSATSSAQQPASPSSFSLSGLPAVFLSPSTWNVVEDYALYLVRHLFLYVGLSKFIWSGKED
jgi:hypothetical protein